MANHADPARDSERVGEIVSIFQRGQVWWANFQHGGRQHRRTLKTRSKKEARQRALRLEAELVNGQLRPNPKPSTVDVAIDEYLQHLRTERRAAKTLTKYTGVLGRLRGLLHERRAASLLDLDIRAVDAYRRARVAAGAANKTIYNETVIVRQLVNFALSRGLIATDPLRGLRISEPRPTPQPCWSPEEVERILAASPASHRSAYELLADTGMRFGEIAHLTWEDVDVGRNVLHVRPKDGWRPKTGDQRAIPMTPRVRSLVERLPRHGRWVMTAPHSTRYPRGDNQASERRLLRVLKRVLKALGLPEHLHTFRHAFISAALTKGIPEAVVREWVGHVDRDTIRLYTHIGSASSQEAMRRLVGELSACPLRGEEVQTEHADDRGTDSVHFQHKSKETPNGSDTK
jgi:site-specific recombinase XerD